MTLKIIVPPHPLVGHWLTILRSASTPSPIYETGLVQLGKWLTYEAIRDWLPLRNEKIECAHGLTEGKVIETRVPLLAIANIPAGVQLWQGAKELLPNATLSIGEGVPIAIEENAGIIIYFDQITTGEVLIKQLNILQKQNIHPKRVRIITCLACSLGLKKIGELFKEITIYAGCIDPELDKEGNIIPGIGDPVKRINTRITPPN